MSGYVSFGAAEHFREGPDLVLREAAPILRSGGILVLSVPWISPLRRLQPALDEKPAEDAHFYQYYLEGQEIESRIANCGFRVLDRTYYGAFKTLRDVLRDAAARRPPKSAEPSLARPERRPDVSSPRVVPRIDFKRKLFWCAQNAVFRKTRSPSVSPDT